MRVFLILLPLLLIFSGLDGLGENPAERKNIKAKYMETWLTATHTTGKDLADGNEFKGKAQKLSPGSTVAPDLPHRMV